MNTYEIIEALRDKDNIYHYTMWNDTYEADTAEEAAIMAAEDFENCHPSDYNMEPGETLNAVIEAVNIDDEDDFSRWDAEIVN